MNRIITKVKKKARGFENKSVENSTGWRAVLADIQSGIERLESLVPIVKGKIERGEPWPGTQSDGQSSERQHSV